MMMLDQTYLRNYYFDWEAFDVLMNKRSALDGDFYGRAFGDKRAIDLFMQGYGYNPNDPIQRAELFGNYQEAVEFVRRYFLKEGNSEGYDYKVPNVLQSITDITDLFKYSGGKQGKEEALWSSIFLKVMHTILHADKDLRYRYFSLIQTQIFDRFYRFMDRDKKNRLFLKSNISDYKIELEDFQTKAKKTRDSIIIKMLHKRENVAEELFDRIGVRFVTKNKFDVLRVISFLIEHNVFVLHNIKPSRSQNSILDMESFRQDYYRLLKNSLRYQWDEETFYHKAIDLSQKDSLEQALPLSNHHSSKLYKAFHFTGRQLIHYQNPLAEQLSEIKRIAKAKKVEKGTDDLVEKISKLKTAHLSREVRFFYPFEVQITDKDSHIMNTKGEASHHKYKKSQVKTAMNRLFSPLEKYYQGRQ